MRNLHVTIGHCLLPALVPALATQVVTQVQRRSAWEDPAYHRTTQPGSASNPVTVSSSSSSSSSSESSNGEEPETGADLQPDGQETDDDAASSSASESSLTSAHQPRHPRDCPPYTVWAGTHCNHRNTQEFFVACLRLTGHTTNWDGNMASLSTEHLIDHLMFVRGSCIHGAVCEYIEQDSPFWAASIPRDDRREQIRCVVKEQESEQESEDDFELPAWARNQQRHHRSDSAGSGVGASVSGRAGSSRSGGSASSSGDDTASGDEDDDERLPASFWADVPGDYSYLIDSQPVSPTHASAHIPRSLPSESTQQNDLIRRERWKNPFGSGSSRNRPNPSPPERDDNDSPVDTPVTPDTDYIPRHVQDCPPGSAWQATHCRPDRTRGYMVTCWSYHNDAPFIRSTDYRGICPGSFRCKPLDELPELRNDNDLRPRVLCVPDSAADRGGASSSFDRWAYRDGGADSESDSSSAATYLPVVQGIGSTQASSSSSGHYARHLDAATSQRQSLARRSPFNPFGLRSRRARPTLPARTPDSSDSDDAGGGDDAGGNDDDDTASFEPQHPRHCPRGTEWAGTRCAPDDPRLYVVHCIRRDHSRPSSRTTSSYPRGTCPAASICQALTHIIGVQARIECVPQGGDDDSASSQAGSSGYGAGSVYGSMYGGNWASTYGSARDTSYDRGRYSGYRGSTSRGW